MRVHLVLFIYLVATVGTAQTENGRVIPKITSLPIEEGEVTLIHLGPGYTTSIRFPEEVRSVVLGNPASFKAEHSEAEPRMVFLKPITSVPSESNVLVTTKSGQEISLQLVSAGKGVVNARVDFVVEYHRRRSMVIDPETQSLVITEIRPTSTIGSPGSDPPKPDPLARELKRQKVCRPRTGKVRRFWGRLVKAWKSTIRPSSDSPCSTAPNEWLNCCRRNLN